MKLDLTKPWAGMVPIKHVVRNPEQPRVKFPDEELERLSVSLRAQGQTSPCTVVPVERGDGGRWMLVDGECRWRAAQMAKLPELLVCYQPGVTLENIHLASFAANFCRTPHTKEETARAVAKEREAGRSYEEIGAVVGKTGAWAEQFHGLLKLHPQLLQWMDEPDPACGRKLAMKVALLLTAHEPEKQMALWKRLRHHESAEMYHKVRVTGVVGAQRAPADDFLYVSSALKQASGHLKRFASTGAVMLRRFDQERLGELRSLCKTVRGQLDAAEAKLCCHAWLAVAPWWAEAIMQSPWAAILVIGLVGAVVFFCALHALEPWSWNVEGAAPPEPGPERPPGAMTEDQREAVLLELLKWWRLDDHPIMDASVAGRCGLTRQQSAAFMHWAKGQVRDFGGERWLCKVESGHQTRWLRFVRVTVMAGEGVEA